MTSIRNGGGARTLSLLLLFFWSAFTWGWFGHGLSAEGEDLGKFSGALLVLAPFLAAGLLWVAERGKGQWRPGLEAVLAEHTRWVDATPRQRLPFLISLAACLTLFGELSVIRLHASDLQLFAYFKNVSLLSCFLGLGVGYAISSRKFVATPLVMPMLALQLLFTNFLERLDASLLLQNPIPEHLSLGMYEARELNSIVAILGFIGLIFAFNALCFLPLGQLCGRLMAREPSKLKAYSWNLVGSIVGVLLFNLASALWAPPSVWIAVTALMLFPFLSGRRALQSSAAAAAVLITAVSWLGGHDHYNVFSPYQKLTVNLERNEPPELEVSNVYFQRMLDLRSEGLAEDADLASFAKYYNLPYRFLADRDEPLDVLIVGSGSGNDVAAAIRNGASRIDAVELDPAILHLGKRFHPENPYGGDSATAVTPHVQDARAFIRYSEKQYDLVVFGLLDSHTLLSNATSVRLDSFVYTVESLREARDRLTDDGMLSLTFSVQYFHLAKKIQLMLQEAFDGRAPLVFDSGYDGGVSFLIGKNNNPEPPLLPVGLRNVTPELARSTLSPDLSTDDWPFLYMTRRQYPKSYLAMILVLIVASATFVRLFIPLDRSTRQASFSAPCFFLGAGFMLIETKGITELALVFGSTWVVVGVVITAILTMAFFANLLVLNDRSPRRSITYLLLLASLLAGMIFSSADVGSMSLTTEQFVRTGLLTLPLLFSGLAFSRELKHAVSVETALSSNILGAMLGGLMEYNSLYTGLRSLYLMAAAMYVIAFVTSMRARRNQEASLTA